MWLADEERWRHNNSVKVHCRKLKHFIVFLCKWKASFILSRNRIGLEKFVGLSRLTVRTTCSVCLGFPRTQTCFDILCSNCKLHTAYPQPKSVKLYRSEPHSFGGYLVCLPSSMADFAPRHVNVQNKPTCCTFVSLFTLTQFESFRICNVASLQDALQSFRIPQKT